MLKKRLDNGFNGFQVPFVPRAVRSSRRRSVVQKNIEDNQLCAFDLLATVAGKILLEGESSHLTATGTDSSYVQDAVMEENEMGNQIVEHCDKGSVEAASPSLTLELGLRGLDQNHNVKEASGSLCNASLAPSSAISLSKSLEKKVTLAEIDLNGDFCCHSGEIDGLPLGQKYPYVPSIVEDAHCPDHGGEMLFGNEPDSHSIEDPEILDKKAPALVSSDTSVKFTLGNETYVQYPCSSQSPCRDNNVNVGSRDDDENSSECIQPSTMKTSRSPARIGDRRIRKLLASRYWRMASKARDGDLFDTEVCCLYRSRKTGYKRPRSQRIYPFKKRRFNHYNSLSNSHADIGFKGVYNYPGTGKVNGSSTSVAGQSTTFSSRESHVKLRIKSFRVPELFIEMPETATIGSLKRRVMQAVSALLGGGLRVGVLLQGKKIRDDNRTLLQSGICNGNKVESLDFSLEPNPSQVNAPICSEENSLLLSTDLAQPVSRCPVANAIPQGTSHLSADHLANNIGNFVESDHDSAPSSADFPADKGIVDSSALVAHPEVTPQALAVVHSHQKSKRSEIQRRIRRPFSVSEVEALVLAVEKLGTGRWRDVKLRAFDNAKHRTYVDLKDKWKTLVHTARIAPQQRRGEPVPQELLDRVLAAHGYWTQQQLKQPPSMTCLLL